VLDVLFRCCPEEVVSQKVLAIPKNAKILQRGKIAKTASTKVFVPLCLVPAAMLILCGSQAVCLRGAWCSCLKPCSISWPVLSIRFYQRWVQISYLEFLLLKSWGILCLPDSDMAYPKDKGKWKTLQPKSSFVQTWSMLRLGSICHLKQLFLACCFSLWKKKLQTRYFSFKGWVFLWLFVFSNCSEIWAQGC